VVALSERKFESQAEDTHEVASGSENNGVTARRINIAVHALVLLVE